MNSLRASLWYMLIALRELPSSLSLYVYVKWILWRDNMIDKLRNPSPQGAIWIVTLLLFGLTVGLFVLTELLLWTLGLN